MSEAADIARFWANVHKADGDACWEWTGALTRTPRSPRGYGNFSIRHHSVRAHRFIWAAINGPIPDGMFVCHRCDNPKCVRPDHLFLGTPQDNEQDKITKGRRNTVTPRGEQQGNSKLTEEAVRAIRLARATGESYRSIGRRFGISGTHACKLCLGKSWRHVA